jgi:hypothetical protein
LYYNWTLLLAHHFDGRAHQAQRAALDLAARYRDSAVSAGRAVVERGGTLKDKSAVSMNVHYSITWIQLRFEGTLQKGLAFLTVLERFHPSEHRDIIAGVVRAPNLLHCRAIQEALVIALGDRGVLLGWEFAGVFRRELQVFL